MGSSQCGCSFTTEETLFEHCKAHDHVATSNLLNLATAGRNTKTDKRQHKTKFPKLSCNICKNKPTSFKKMFDHLKNQHSDILNCIFCDQNFENNIQMLDHLKIHGKGFYCKEHFMAFNSYQELLNHVQTPGHDLECGVCQTIFKSRYARDFHRATHFKTSNEPARKGEFKCSQCPTVYNYIGSLKRHIKTFHQKRVFLCEDCGASFTTNFILRRHVAKVHQKGIWPDSLGPNHCCEFCGKIFATKSVLTKHRVKHLDQGEFCQYCYESFDSTEKLKEHIETLDHNLFRCNTCKATFKAKENYQKHILKHSETNNKAAPIKDGIKKPRRPRTFKKPIIRKYPYKIVDGKKQYECQICEKVSPSISNFARHLEIHSGVKKYTCEKCGKAFAQYVGLKAHFSVHSNDRPYTCPICGNCYKDLRNLIKHRGVHEKSLLADYNSASFVPKRKKCQKRSPIDNKREFVPNTNNSEKAVFSKHFLGPSSLEKDSDGT